MCDTFGALREILQQSTLSDVRRRSLWLLIERMATAQPERYRELWLPYIASFPHHLSEPLATVQSVKALERAARWVPEAIFALKLERERCEAELKALLEAPAAGAVGRIELTAPHPVLEQIRRLGQVRHLSRLKHLELRRCALGAEGLPALLASPFTKALELLAVERAQLGDEGIRLLAGSPPLAALKSLSLRGNGIGPSGIKALASSPYLTRLERLDLSDNPLGDHGAEALARWPHLAALTRLDLDRDALGPRGVKALATSPYLSEAIKAQLCR